MFTRVFLILVVTTAAGCAAKVRPDLTPPVPARSYPGLDTIGKLKTFEETLGGHATENFLRVSDRPVADVFGTNLVASSLPPD